MCLNVLGSKTIRQLGTVALCQQGAVVHSKDMTNDNSRFKVGRGGADHEWALC